MKINISSRTLLAFSNNSKPSGCSGPVGNGLPGVAIEIACGVGDFAGGPGMPMRLIADVGSGISCCSLLPPSSLGGKGGDAEGFTIGGADGGGLEKPSEPTDGDTTTEPDLGVDTNPVLTSARKAAGEDAEGVPTPDADLLVQVYENPQARTPKVPCC